MLAQKTKHILKLKKHVSSYSSALKKFKNTEFKPKSITKNIDLVTSKHAMSASAFEVA